MCGRYSLFAPPERLEDRFDARFEQAFEPRYNAAPGQSLPVITDAAPDTFQFLRWGLVPSWADDESTSFINARAETLSDKRSFREPFEQRRCLVPADGFYEWVDERGGKQPYRVSRPGDEPFAMAGLWERWQPPQKQTGLGEFGGDGPDRTAEPVETFTVVTTEPNDVVADLHHRMAVIVDAEAESTWLHGDTEAARAVLAPYDGALRTHRVSTAVNDPSNDSPSIVEPVGTE